MQGLNSPSGVAQQSSWLTINDLYGKAKADTEYDARYSEYTIFSENLIFFLLPVITFFLFLLCK